MSLIHWKHSSHLVASALGILGLGILILLVIGQLGAAPAHTTLTARIGTQEFELYEPRTIKQMQTGLAAYSSLGDTQGMIFRGLPADNLAIWMKDMKFDIDVIWVNSQGSIVYIEQNIKKESYPIAYINPKNKPASYIIELKAGTIERYSIILGSSVTISEN